MRSADLLGCAEPGEVQDADHLRTITALVDRHQRRRDVVSRWTPTKAAVLAALDRELKITTRRAMAAAGVKTDDATPRGQPGLPERLAAAAYLTEVIGGPPDEVTQAASYSRSALSDAETLWLCGHLAGMLQESPIPQ